MASLQSSNSWQGILFILCDLFLYRSCMRFYFISSFGSFRVFGGTAVTTMISAVAWVPRGAAKPVPKQAEVDAAELEAMKQQLEAQEAEAGEDGDDGEEDEEDSEGDEGDSAGMSEDSDEEETGGAATAVAQAKAAAAALRNASGKKSKRDQSSTAADGLDQALAELDMDNYDNEDAAVPNLVSRAMGGKLEMLGDDPYLTLGDSDEDSEIEDLELKPDDLLILAARSEDDIHNLEVWVYEEPEQLGYEANVYVHHEVVLPAFPLCLAWLDLNPSLSNPASARGNLVAVGSMEPGIEIWDLDVVDAVEPAAVLGGEDTVAMKAALEEAKQAATKGGEEKLDKKKKKKLKEKVKKAGPLYRPGSHQGPVLGLCWNREYRNVLASASADTTVKVWDITKGTAEHTLTHHSDKVQAVAWNPAESPVLLTGGFDKLAALADVRTPDGSPARWELSADVEALAWSPHDPTQFLVSCEDGIVASYDARKGAGSDPLFRLEAHGKPTCALSFSLGARGLLATASTDKTAKLWDISSGAPALLASQDLQVGAVFTMGFSSDAPYLMAVGGAKGSVTVWDVRAVPSVTAKFPGLLQLGRQGAAATAGQ